MCVQNAEFKFIINSLHMKNIGVCEEAFLWSPFRQIIVMEIEQISTCVCVCV